MKEPGHPVQILPADGPSVSFSRSEFHSLGNTLCITPGHAGLLPPRPVWKPLQEKVSVKVLGGYGIVQARSLRGRSHEH